MHLPHGLLAVGIFGVVFSLAVPVWEILFKRAVEHEGPRIIHALIIVFGILLLINGALIFAYFRESYWLASWGMNYRTFTKRGKIGWDEIKRVRFSRSAFWFRFDIKDGRAIRVSG
jgi:hypothetical protein